MRRFASVALAAALLVPVGIAVSGPAQAADAPAAFCHRSVPNGTMTASPGLKYLVKRKQSYALTTKTLVCSGAFVRGVDVSLHSTQPIAISCTTAVGVVASSGSTSGLLTWTKPANSGKSKWHGYITITATSGHTTTAKLKGVINTSPANTLLGGHKVTGTLKFSKGLALTTNGGDCQPNASLKDFPVSSISMTIH
jgi:hypothetical protein